MGDAGSSVKSIKITGIGKAGRGPNGKIPQRREIDNWWFDKSINAINQRSLFIYALINLQARGLDDPNQSDPLSYFSIAGIHGLPLQPWPVGNQDKTQWYCTHGKTLFSTWHTPYMLLYEQRLWEEMRDLIPSTFAEEDHQAMYEAADTWRLPFWDWAKKKPSWNADNPDDPVNDPTRVDPTDGPNVPFIITQTEIEVRTATGATKVRNPMFNFAVPKGRTFGNYQVKEERTDDSKVDNSSPWIASCSITSRHPNFPGLEPEEELTAEKWHALPIHVKEDYNQGKNQNWRKVQEALQGNVKVKTGKDYDNSVANPLPEAVRRLFRSKNGRSPLNFESFSTGYFKAGQAVEKYPSLESIHNDLHVFAGGNGYMGYPGTAAFDPLFWLHHCNVDRLLASWQIMFADQYDEWLANAHDGGDNPDTELKPFAKDENFTYFSSRDSSKMFDHFGYEYETLEGGNAQSARTLARDFSQLYPTTAYAALQLKENKNAFEVFTTESNAVDLPLTFASPILMHEATKREPSSSAEAKLRQLTWSNNDYVANVVYERFALDGRPFSVGIFIGESPGLSLFDIGRDETAVGTVYNFSSIVEGRGATVMGCESCKIQQQNRAKFSGQVILTDALIAKILNETEENGIILDSLDENTVVPYLKANLHFKVFDTLNRPINSEIMRDSVSVSVAVSHATHYAEIGRDSDYTIYRQLWEVTDGKALGASGSEQIYA